MANDKKNDKKEETKAATPTTVAPAAVAESQVIDGPPPTQSSGALMLIQAGVQVPTVEEMDKLAVLSDEAMTALSALLQDKDLSDESKGKVQTLLDQARPQKPGMEEVNTTWTVTRLSIAQPTTQAAAKPESAKQGDIFSQAGTLIERPFSFIPLWFHEENVLFPEGARVPECSAPDAKLGQPFGLCIKCPHLPFGKQNAGRGDQKQTDCQNQIVVAALSTKLDAVYILTFAKTSRKAGNALISLAKNDPFPWKKSYLLQTEKQTGDKGTYFIYKIEPTGKENAPDAIKIGAALNGLYGANRKKMLAEYKYRAANASVMAAQIESTVDPNLLMGGVGGEEPDLGGAPTPSVRGASKPM